MTNQTTPAAVARAFTDAWTTGDLDTAATYLTDDIVFDGPLGHVEGKTAYLESLRGLSNAMGVTGARVLAAYGDDATQALIMYELLTDRYGALTCAKLFTFRDGAIASDCLTFDSYPVRQGS